MTLNMICLGLNPSALSLWGHRHRKGGDPRYLVHAATRKVFGQFGPQPFCIQAESNRILGYCETTDTVLREKLDMCKDIDPLLSTVFRLPEICTRTMPSTWHNGSRYRFMVQCRPTTRFHWRSEKPSQDRPYIESDAWLYKMFNDWSRTDKRLSLREYRLQHRAEMESVYTEWLRDHLMPAATVENVTIVGSRNTTLTSRGGKKHEEAPKQSRTRKWPETTFSGTLTVQDPALFDKLIRQGVGRHAAFGFGMLLLQKC